MIIFKRSGTIEIPTSKVRPNPNQPRKYFDEKELDELCISINEFGIIQPIVVTQTADSDYVLIAGERRLRAAVLLGLERIPAVIRDVDDRDSTFMALVENVQRQNLGYIEEAEAYQKLIEEYGFTQNEIAARVGKRQSTISNKIRLLSLPDDIKILLTENKLTERHARALLRINDEDLRRKVIKKIIKNGLNVSQSEKLIDDIANKQNFVAKEKDRLRFINYKLYVNTIKKAFSYIRDVEKDATLTQHDLGDYMELKIIIPKNSSVDKSALDSLRKVNV